MPIAGYNSDGQPIDENGNRAFAGLGNINPNAGNQSFQQQGFAGVGGQPPVQTPAPLIQPRPMDTSGMLPNPNARTSGLPSLSNPNAATDNYKWGMDQAAYTDSNGRVVTRPGWDTTGIIGAGNSNANISGYGTGQMNPNTRGSSLSQLGSGSSSPMGGNPMARQGSTQDLSNITYNQQQGKAALASPNGRGASAIGFPADATGELGGNNQPDAQGRKPYGSIGSPQARPDSNDRAGGFDNIYQGDYVNNPRVDKSTGMIDRGWVQAGIGPDGATEENFLDPSAIKYDPEFGWITMAQNMRDKGEDTLSKWMPWLVGGALGGAALSAAGAFGGAATTAGSSAVPDLVGAGVGVGTDTGAAATGWGVEGGVTTGLGAGATEAGGGLSGLGSLLDNPMVRRAGTTLAGQALNGLGRSGSPTGGPTGGNTNSGSGSLGDLALGGFNLYNDNKGIQNIQDMMWQMYNRGDYNSQYRPGYLQSLADSYTPEGSARLLAPYADADARHREDDVRKLNAAGFGGDMMQSGVDANGKPIGGYGSGNAMGEIAKLQKSLDQEHLGQERQGLRANADLGNPGAMAAAGMRNLPFLAQMQSNRNSAANGILKQVIGGKSIEDWMKGLKDGSIKQDEVPTEVTDTINNGEANGGPQWDYGSNGDPNGEPVNWGDDAADVWKWFFG